MKAGEYIIATRTAVTNGNKSCATIIITNMTNGRAFVGHLGPFYNANHTFAQRTAMAYANFNNKADITSLNFWRAARDFAYSDFERKECLVIYPEGIDVGKIRAELESLGIEHHMIAFEGEAVSVAYWPQKGGKVDITTNPNGGASQKYYSDYKPCFETRPPHNITAPKNIKSQLLARLESLVDPNYGEVPWKFVLKWRDNLKKYQAGNLGVCIDETHVMHELVRDRKEHGKAISDKEILLRKMISGYALSLLHNEGVDDARIDSVKVTPNALIELFEGHLPRLVEVTAKFEKYQSAARDFRTGQDPNLRR